MAELQGAAALHKRFAALSAGGATHQLLGQLGQLAVREARALAPRRTGNLQRSIRLGPVTASSVTIIAGGVSNVGYAAIVERGSRPHVIVPRNRRALRWAPSASGRRLTGTPRIGAGVVFATRVNHPGTKAHPYLVPGALNAVRKGGLAGSIVRAWNDAA